MTSARSPHYSELRRAVIRLAVSVIVLDAAAIGLYVALGVSAWTDRNQYLFLGSWIAATLLVVLSGLARVKAARRRVTPAP